MSIAHRDSLELALAGQLYKLVHQTPVTGIAGTTAYVATTPQLLVAQVTGEKRRVGLRNLRLWQVGTVAGALVHVAVLADDTDRYTAATGTDVALKGPAMDNAKAVPAQTILHVKTGPTATAASANVRVLANASQAASLGAAPIELPGPFFFKGLGSILVYWYAGTTAPTLAFDADVILEDVPA